MRRYLAFLVLLALSSLTVGFQRSANQAPATTPNLHALRTDPNAYLSPRFYEPVGGVVIIHDDGFSSFKDTVIAKCDSIFAADGVQINATVPVTPYWLNGNGAGDLMSWDDLKSFSHRQDTYEICLHGAGNNDENFGYRNAGYTSAWHDSLLTDWESQFATNGVAWPASMCLPNNRYAPGQEAIWMKHKIYQVASLAVPATFDSTSGTPPSPWENEHTYLEQNSDPFVPLGSNVIAVGHWAYQRTGGIQNRWNIGRRSGFSYNSANMDSLKANILLAVQTRTTVWFTFHDVKADTTGDGVATSSQSMLDTDYTEFLAYVSQWMQTGLLESYTAEEAAARGTGRLYGEVLNRDNFGCLTDYAADAADSTFMVSVLPRANRVPIGWPMNQANEGVYVGASGVDSLVVRSTAAGDSSMNKIWDNGAQGDTILAHFTDESIPDEVSYAGSSPTGRIWISSSADGSTSKAIPIVVPVTGAQSRYAYVTVTAMVDNATGDGYLAARLGAWAEEWNNIRSVLAAPSYDFTFYTSKDGAYDNVNINMRQARVYPLFNPTFEDSTQSNQTAALPSTVWGNTDTNPILKSTKEVRPYIMDNRGGTGVYETPFGDMVNFDGLTKSMTIKLELFDGADVYNSVTYGEAAWRNYIFMVEMVPGKTDYIAGHVWLTDGATGGSWTGSPTLIVSNVSVVVPPF